LGGRKEPNVLEGTLESRTLGSDPAGALAGAASAAVARRRERRGREIIEVGLEKVTRPRTGEEVIVIDGWKGVHHT